VSLLPVGWLALVLVAGAGGPDQGGYRWWDSDSVGGPTFQWVDITGTGTPVVLGDDDNQGPFPLGFEFSCYAMRSESVRVCSNGWLSFVSASHQFHHFPIPDGHDPNAVLAPLWADLDPSSGGAVYYRAEAAAGRFIVSWVGVPCYGMTGTSTFQAIVDTGGSVLFQYLDVPDGLDSCAAGIEDEDGAVGLEYWFDGRPAANRLHDSLAVRFSRLQRDVAPVVLCRPFDEELAGNTVVPVALVWNPGMAPASFPVTLAIGAGYEASVDVENLAALADTVVRFPAWTVSPGSSAARVSSSLAGDEFPGNDTLFREVSGTLPGELRHDDGVPDTSFLRVGAPSMDWAAATAFSPPWGEYRLLGGRVFALDTLPFARLLVCPDSAGAPDLGRPYYEAESAAAALPGSWLAFDADTVVRSAGDVWLVVFWPRAADGPAIGDDSSPPVDGRSCFGPPAVRWLPHEEGDLLMRLRIEPTGGITGPRAPARADLRLAPNPARGRVVLRLAAPCPSRTAGRVFDPCGRMVHRFELEPGTETWEWDGTDASGRALAGGTYFVELRGGAPAGRVRLLLTR